MIYEGGQTADAIVQYMKVMEQPSTKSVSTAEDAITYVRSIQVDFLPQPGFGVLGFFKKGKTNKEWNQFETLAHQLRGHYPFVHVEDANATYFGAKGSNATNKIILLKPYDEMLNLYNGALELKSFSEWMKDNAFPRINPIDEVPRLVKKLEHMKRPMIYVFGDVFKPQSNTVTEIFLTAQNVSKNFKGEYYTVMTAHMKNMEPFGLDSGTKLPRVGIRSVDGDFYTMPETAPTLKQINKFVADQRDGTIKPYIPPAKVRKSNFDL